MRLLKRLYDAGMLLLAREAPALPGCFVALGGGEAAAEILADALAEVAGPLSKVCVIGAAAADPVARGHKSADILRKAGFVPVVLDLRPHGRDLAAYRNAHHIERCAAIYFAGGSQVLLARALRGDEDYPVLAAIRAAARRGTVIAGTSAGAAVLGAEMISGGASHDSLSRGKKKVRRMEGLGFLKDVVVDQHFIARGHLGRLIAFLRRYDKPVGLGIDEGAAVVFAGPAWRVLGKSHAVLIEMGEPIVVSLLAGGERYLPDRRLIRPAEDARPVALSEPGLAVQTDVFGRAALSDMLGRMVEKRAAGAVGFSLPGEGASADAVGGAYRVSFRPTAATAAFERQAEGAARFSVHRLALVIEKVSVQFSVVGPW